MDFAKKQFFDESLNKINNNADNALEDKKNIVKELFDRLKNKLKDICGFYKIPSSYINIIENQLDQTYDDVSRRINISNNKMSNKTLDNLNNIKISPTSEIPINIQGDFYTSGLKEISSKEIDLDDCIIDLKKNVQRLDINEKVIDELVSAIKLFERNIEEELSDANKNLIKKQTAVFDDLLAKLNVIKNTNEEDKFSIYLAKLDIMEPKEALKSINEVIRQIDNTSNDPRVDILYRKKEEIENNIKETSSNASAFK